MFTQAPRESFFLQLHQQPNLYLPNKKNVACGPLAGIDDKDVIPISRIHDLRCRLFTKKYQIHVQQADSHKQTQTKYEQRLDYIS